MHNFKKTNLRIIGGLPVVDVIDIDPIMPDRLVATMSEEDADALMSSVVSPRFAAMIKFCSGISTGYLQNSTPEEYLSSQIFNQITAEITDEKNHEQKMIIAGEPLKLIGSALAASLVGLGAKNCITMSCSHPSVGDMLLTIQRKEGASPSDLLAEANKKINSLCLALSQIHHADDSLERHELRAIATRGLRDSGEL